jgi:hypothetical protein
VVIAGPQNIYRSKEALKNSVENNYVHVFWNSTLLSSKAVSQQTVKEASYTIDICIINYSNIVVFWYVLFFRNFKIFKYIIEHNCGK